MVGLVIVVILVVGFALWFFLFRDTSGNEDVLREWPTIPENEEQNISDEVEQEYSSNTPEQEQSMNDFDRNFPKRGNWFMPKDEPGGFRE